jgi:hypothetical protein
MLQLPVFLMLLTLAQADDDGDFGRPKPVYRQLLESIAKNGYQRVGVLPRFLVREGGREVLGGSIGPEADYLPERLEESLVQFGGGKFKVIDGRQLREAFKSLKIEDLGNREALGRAASAVGGMDALVVGIVTDMRAQAADGRRAPLEIQARLIDVKDSSVTSISKEIGTVTLSDAAYMGESWELRRWSGDQLQIVGLRQPSEGPGGRIKNMLYGGGSSFDLLHYPLIRRDLPHPLLNRDCPYRLAVVVDGKERPLERVGGKIYVALDPGDTYWIRVENKIPRPVYMSVFVDGVNVQGKKREHPANAKYWYLKPNYTSNLKGWYTGQAGNYSVEEFVIAPASDTVAAGQGFGQQLGLITVVFNTIGMQGIPKSGMIAFAPMPGSFGTGAGRRTGTRLEMVEGDPPGLILAAMTVYYVTSARLEELRKGGR